MVRLVIYPYDMYSERYDGRKSDDCLVPDWRSSALMLVPSANSNLLIKSENPEINDEFLNQNPFDHAKNSFSANSFESINRSVSQYWNDVWRYHWSIAVQSIFLVTIIVALGPWIGYSCNQHFSDMEDYPSVTWPFPMLSNFKTGFHSGDTAISKSTWGYGFCCFSQNIEGSSTRRRASFLKRKRITKAFDDF